MTRKTDKQPVWLKSVSECLVWCGRDRNWFSTQGFEQLGKDPKDGRKSLYDVRIVCARAMGLGISANGEDDGIPNKAEEDARLTKAKRVSQELDNDERQGVLRPVSEVGDAIVAALLPVCAMLENLPLAIKRECPEISQFGIEKIEREIALARNELAEQPVIVGGGIEAQGNASGSASEDGS